MSIEWRPRELGVIVHCDGTDEDYCKATIATANCRADANRSHAKSQGWGRGLRKGRKRCDQCPACLKIEQELLVQENALREQRKRERAAVKKDRLDASKPLPKKPRKKKGDAANSPQAAAEEYLPSPSSPSADSAPAAAT